MKLKDIDKFEKANEINVNMYSYDDETRKLYALRLSKGDSEECVNLLFYDEHYSVVKDMSRLLASQLSKK